VLEDERTEWQRVSLSDVGAEGIYFEVLMCGGREEVGLLDSIPIDRVVTLLHHIAGFMGSALEKANPSKASAELGVEFGLEEGKLVALRVCPKTLGRIAEFSEHEAY
jgi:hypothetical protein